MNLWRFSDRRRGHDAQSLGLTRALCALISCNVYELAATPWPQALVCWISGAFAAGAALPDPDLIIGAGHGTHLSLLAARRARGGRAIVLMRPTLPSSWFDCCIIPEHDGVAAGRRIIVSRGPLNFVSPAGSHDRAAGLILIGGPSRHAAWRFNMYRARIQALSATPGIAWTVCDSPRTPVADSAALAVLGGIRFVSWRDAGAGWLAENLAEFGQIWVTGDSVSMVYEALSAGAAVGVMDDVSGAANRVSRAIAALVARGDVTTFEAWQSGRRPEPPDRPLREAHRCATLLLDILRQPHG